MFKAKLRTANNLTVVVDNVPYSVSIGHPNWDLLEKAYNSNDSKSFIELLDVNEGVKQYVAVDTNGNKTALEIRDDGVYYKGNKLHNVLVDRIMSLRANKHPIDDMVKFLENLLKNPSSSSRNELYDFLENKALPITPNGTFIGYKAVKNDFYSKTAGKLVLLQGKTDENGHIFNGIGEVIECERGDVDDERRNECSYGLHVGGLDYATITFKGSNDRVVLVEVNPADVVSVPKDYNAQKLRACKYSVIGEYTAPLSSVSSREDFYVEEEDEDWVEEEDPILVEDLEEDDEVSFMYEGQTRYGYVVENDNVLRLELTSQDPSFVEGKTSYRNFAFDKISNIDVF